MPPLDARMIFYSQVSIHSCRVSSGRSYLRDWKRERLKWSNQFQLDPEAARGTDPVQICLVSN